MTPTENKAIHQDGQGASEPSPKEDEPEKVIKQSDVNRKDLSECKELLLELERLKTLPENSEENRQRTFRNMIFIVKESIDSYKLTFEPNSGELLVVKNPQTITERESNTNWLRSIAFPSPSLPTEETLSMWADVVMILRVANDWDKVKEELMSKYEIKRKQP